MKLIKKRNLTATESASVSSGVLGSTVDRRAFLRRAGLGLGGTAVAATLPTTMIRRAEAARDIDPNAATEVRKSVCTHCSVGCGVVAEVQNGVWTGQEPDFDSPFNMGGHCAKGASVREHGHGERRLKYPMKLTGGKWTKVSWDQAIDEIGDKVIDIRKQSGPDSVYWLGSAKFNNEQAYLFRKFAALWGTNNVDHQARICHSTTVAGVANTWGYGAMTNSYNDMHNSKAMFFIGSNAAEAHPVAMQHVLRGKENGAKMIVVDPRFTRTAAHADHYMRIRPGSDVPIIWGVLWHIFENGWEDKEYIRQRVYGMDEIRAEVANWTPDVVENVTGVSPEDCKKAAQMMAENRPGTIVWCMGGTQHTIGNNNTRAYCALQLALGNVGVSGGGANIFRGHDNVQGATDLGILSHTLPGYYGLSDGAWKHWSGVWGLDYEWVVSRFDTGYMDTAADTEEGQAPVPFANPMNSAGMPVSRWIDGVLEDSRLIDQRDQLKAMFFLRRSCPTGRKACTCCPPRPSSRPTARSPRRTARCSGATKSSIRCSRRFPTTRSCTSCRRSSSSRISCSRTSRSRTTNP
jgi:formate dehydrogenase major subunit